MLNHLDLNQLEFEDLSPLISPCKDQKPQGHVERILQKKKSSTPGVKAFSNMAMRSRRIMNLFLWGGRL
jgi:hypothetical protein